MVVGFISRNTSLLLVCRMASFYIYRLENLPYILGIYCIRIPPPYSSGCEVQFSVCRPGRELSWPSAFCPSSLVWATSLSHVQSPEPLESIPELSVIVFALFVLFITVTLSSGRTDFLTLYIRKFYHLRAISLRVNFRSLYPLNQLHWNVVLDGNKYNFYSLKISPLLFMYFSVGYFG